MHGKMELLSERVLVGVPSSDCCNESQLRLLDNLYK